MTHAMLDKSPLDAVDDELTPDQLHRTDDPDVWGLLDVALNRITVVPQTIYKVSGDSASGVVGLLTPDGVFSSAARSRVGSESVVGTLHDVNPSPGEAIILYETNWDGAAPAREFLNEENEPAQEHSRGLLLGEYPNRYEKGLKFAA